MSVGKNTVAGEELKSIVESIERLEAEKKELSDEITAKYADAKSRGFNTKAIRGTIKRRKAKPHDLQEHDALMDLYQHALGMLPEPPLFRAVANFDQDELTREVVIEQMKKIVPPDGEIIVKVGKPVRIFRVKDGEAQVEDYNETPRPGRSRASAAPLNQAPKPDVPDVSDEQAETLGGMAASDNIPIVDNPFPFGDSRRARWDTGWRKGNGGDGMGPA